MKFLSFFRLTVACGIIFGCLACGGKLSKEPITVKTDKDSIDMGRSVMVTAHINFKKGESPKDILLLPYVNQRRWGSHERPDSNGNATFLLPLPNPGNQEIQVIAIKADNANWMGTSRKELLIAGTIMPATDSISNVCRVNVKRRAMPSAPDNGHLFCVQWESWFIPGPGLFSSAEAVPVVGIYDSYNEDVIRQHVLWFMDLGVNFIMPDWSNHIWTKKHWNEIDGGARSIVHATTVFLEVLAKMRDEGMDVPKVALMPGISNGPPATMVALNEQMEWIYQNYVLNPRFKGLFQEFEGKPLMIILDTGALGSKKGTAESAFRIPFFKQTLAMSETELDAFRRAQGPVDDSKFTIRWMSSQNQVTRHHELGYWSWMDGSLEPMVTYKDGKAEAITVTNAFFEPLGWTAPDTWGKRGGTTYIESFKFALKSRPQVIFLHQFNEFAGQPEGHGLGKNHEIYLDEHSMEFSDDFEPVSMTAAGLRDKTGGWGFYYLNMTKALMDIFNGKDMNSTVMAANVREKTDQSVKVVWSVIGREPANYTVSVGEKVLFKEMTGSSIDIPLKEFSKGKNTVTIVANGVNTRYKLSTTEMDEISDTPLPVEVKLSVSI